jgi:hypothetical protein
MTLPDFEQSLLGLMNHQAQAERVEVGVRAGRVLGARPALTHLH